MKACKKTISRVLAVLLALAVVLVGTVYALWHNEIATLTSMKLLRERNDEHLDGAVSPCTSRVISIWMTLWPRAV